MMIIVFGCEVIFMIASTVKIIHTGSASFRRWYFSSSCHMCTSLYRSYQPLSSQHYDVAEQLCSNKLRSKMAKNSGNFNGLMRHISTNSGNDQAMNVRSVYRTTKFHCIRDSSVSLPPIGYYSLDRPLLNLIGMNRSWGRQCCTSQIDLMHRFCRWMAYWYGFVQRCVCLCNVQQLRRKES